MASGHLARIGKTLKRTFSTENLRNLILISLNVVLKIPLGQVMAQPALDYVRQ